MGPAGGPAMGPAGGPAMGPAAAGGNRCISAAAEQSYPTAPDRRRFPSSRPISMTARTHWLRNLFGELKRRKVVRTSIAYGVAAGAIIQVSSAVVPALFLPPELLTGIVVVCIAGLPIAAALSWYYEITPERPAPEVDDDAEAAAAAGRAGAAPDPAWQSRVIAAPPQPVTPFIGRERETGQLSELLCDGSARLVTVLGPGGVGKTRLAAQAADAARHHFADGMRWIGLSPLRSAELLPTALAEGCGVTLSRGAEPLTELLDYLRQKQLLLVLDNFDELTHAAAVLARVLDEAPGVRLLVTSRERLHLKAETLMAVEGLDLHDESGVGTSDALRLFLATAGRLDRAFTLDDGARPAAQQICALLEGVPLAIELAASWTRVMDCAAILLELQKGLDLLADDAPDLPERQRSMRASFDASWRLLDAPAQTALARLSVFRLPFTRAAARAIAGAELPLLRSLVDKSLLTPGAGLFAMSDVVRQFAGERLNADAPAADATRGRHAGHFAELLQGMEPGLARSDPASVAAAGAIINEIRGAWDHAVQRRDTALLRQLARPVFDYYDARGLAREGLSAFQRAADAIAGSAVAAGDSAAVAGMINVRLGAFHNMLGLQGDAERLLRDGLSAARAAGVPAETAFALQRLGANLLVTGDYDGAAAAHGEAARIAEDSGDAFRLGRSLAQLGNVAWSRGRLDEAAALCGRAVAMSRAEGDSHGLWIALNTLGVIAANRRSYDEARARFRDALTIQQAQGNQRSAATLLHNLGNVARLDGDMDEARSYLLQGLAISEHMGYQGWAASTLAALGHLDLHRGDTAAATGMLQRAVQTALSAGNTPVLLQALVTVARLFSLTGRDDDAVRTASLVAAHPATDQEARASAATLLRELSARALPSGDPDDELAAIVTGFAGDPQATPPPDRETRMTERRRAGLATVLLLVSVPLGCAQGLRSVPIADLTPLACAQTPPQGAEDRTIGQGGGSLRAGRNEIVIPANALPAGNRIPFRLQTRPNSAAVDLTPHGASFQRDVTVFLSFEHCTAAELAGRTLAIYRVPGNGNAAIRLGGTVEDGRIWALTRTNSGFIIVAE
jgi:predicted ATPase/Tfp pilus assembly protein PilF